ncbi:hypothetical protein LJR130_001052 [Variovorax sp. LjRoot130]|uniref:hypothetical protein n=1 Tax=Variovorax sp. LjRoot130 TaxID=3342261 RepID=UPI003ECFF7F5
MQKNLRSLAALLSLGVLSLAAHATCIGSGSFQTCTDASGNTYNVQRFGNTTHVQGMNPSTSSNWNQTSTTIGNTTMHNGTAANGNMWNGTSQHIGGTTFHNGIDSHGNPYSKTCTAYGCF